MARNGSLLYDTGLRHTPRPELPRRPVGTLTYNNGARATLSIPREAAPTFPAQWSALEHVNGLSIPSHRAIASYQRIETIPAGFSSSQALLDQFVGQIRTTYLTGYSGKTAATWMKESLIAAALYGEGNSAVQANPDARAVWRGFQRVLTKLLPDSLRFQKLLVRGPEVVISTRTGEFLLDAASGGVMALFELGWQIFLRSRSSGSFTVLYDEPENHLHPSLQRTLMPQLIQAFPDVTFIVATHSPFIVTSVPDAHVYVLEYQGQAVRSNLLDTREKARTADETLRRVLGVESTLPLWAEDRLLEIIDRYQRSDMTRKALQDLRIELESLGLAEEFPAAAAALARASDAAAD